MLHVLFVLDAFPDCGKGLRLESPEGNACLTAKHRTILHRKAKMGSKRSMLQRTTASLFPHKQ